MNKTIVITGAGRGIGRAAAQHLAGADRQLVLASRTRSELASLVDELQQHGGHATAVTCDVAEESAVEQLITTAAEIGDGTIDVLICAAGVARIAPFTELSLHAWQESLNSNLTGTFLCCRFAAPHMQQGGLIIALGSIAGRTGFPQWSAYSAAKFGLMGFTQAIREELRPQGVRVTTLIPGAVDTPLWQDVPGSWNRDNMLQAAEIAHTIKYVVDLPAHVQVDELVIGHAAGKL